MTLEEMLWELRMIGENGEGSRVCVLSGHTADKITAALKAGQALAETVAKWDNGFISGREARKQVTEKRQAWDAATKEEGA